MTNPVSARLAALEQQTRKHGISGHKWPDCDCGICTVFRLTTDALAACLPEVRKLEKENETMKNKLSRGDVSADVPAAGSTAQSATSGAPTIDADLALDIATELESAFDPGGNLPEDCEEWAEKCMDLIGKLRGAAECSLMEEPESPQSELEGVWISNDPRDNGVIKIHHGVSEGPRCEGRCYDPEGAPPWGKPEYPDDVAPPLHVQLAESQAEVETLRATVRRLEQQHESLSSLFEETRVQYLESTQELEQLRTRLAAQMKMQARVKIVVEAFEESERLGYRSRERQYAVELLRPVLTEVAALDAPK